MAKTPKDIEYLEPGWRWVKAGEEEWTTSTGEKSTARHGRKGTETLSTRQVQNRQREVRAAQGQPKAPTVHRTGKSRTIKFTKKQKGRETDVTKSEKIPTGIGSIYNPERHGRTEALVFRSFEDARDYAATQGLPSWATVGMISIHYTERLFTTNKPGSDELDKNGFASLTGFFYTDQAQGPEVFAISSGDLMMPWEEAEFNMMNYDMSADYSRVYIYLMER